MRNEDKYELTRKIAIHTFNRLKSSPYYHALKSRHIYFDATIRKIYTGFELFLPTNSNDEDPILECHYDFNSEPLVHVDLMTPDKLVEKTVKEVIEKMRKISKK